MKNIPLPQDGLIAVTYRCNARCQMCHTWQFPTRPEEELKPNDLRTLPELEFCNITGGEPFLREDLAGFVEVLGKKAKRIVISTNGYFTERILKLARDYPGIGVRVSIEGMRSTNDQLRGLKDGFERGLDTLRELRGLGLKDIGFGITLSDGNILDLMGLYALSKKMGLEFASACVHNTYYFHKFDNQITRLDDFDRELRRLITDLLKSAKPKNWFRGYFNYGLLNYAHGRKRLLPCRMGRDVFFVDPFGEVMACNGLEMSMGNIKDTPFPEIWKGKKAQEVRLAAGECQKNCWMVGSVAPEIKRNIFPPAAWVLANKLRLLAGKDIKLSLKK